MRWLVWSQKSLSQLQFHVGLQLQIHNGFMKFKILALVNALKNDKIFQQLRRHNGFSYNVLYYYFFHFFTIALCFALEQSIIVTTYYLIYVVVLCTQSFPFAFNF